MKIIVVLFLLCSLATQDVVAVEGNELIVLINNDIDVKCLSESIEENIFSCENPYIVLKEGSGNKYFLALEAVSLSKELTYENTPKVLNTNFDSVCEALGQGDNSFMFGDNLSVEELSSMDIKGLASYSNNGASLIQTNLQSLDSRNASFISIVSELRCETLAWYQKLF